MATCIGTLIVPLLLYFAVYFPVTLKKPGWYFHILTLGPAVIFMILAVTPYLVPAVILKSRSAQPADLGTLYSLQTLYIVVGFIASSVIMLHKLHRVSARARAQIWLVFIGLLAVLAVNLVTGFVLTISKQSNSYSNAIGGVSFLFLVAMIAYAIVRQRLFDIRLAISRTIGFTLTIGLISVLYSLLIFSFGVPLLNNGHLSIVKNDYQLLLFIPPTIFVALTFSSLRKFMARVTNRIFYQDTYDIKSTLDSLSDVLIGDSSIDELMSGSLSIISDAIKPSNCLFVVLDNKGGIYKHLVINRPEPKQLNNLIEYSKNLSNRILVKDEVQAGNWSSKLAEEDISLLLKLNASNKLIGLLFFGQKQDGRIYNRQDIDLVVLSAKNLGVAIENAENFEQITQFSEVMHQEVLKATASLRHANTKLKTLDALKDDFISMASHQLRSPATSVHEAIQMIQQTNLTKEERKQIVDLAEASSERLVNVINNMLSITRIQAGHSELEKQQVDLVELANRAILECSGSANKKNIKLRFDGHKSHLKLLADRAKLNEMMSNYIDNAINYSHEGSTITISLQLDSRRHRASFEVNDQGIGVPVGEQKNLFGKFYRATNAQKELPNGNGIGLFVVKTFAKAHGGDAYYRPLNTGSVFGFWLPV